MKSHNNKEGKSTEQFCKLIQRTNLTKSTVPKAFQMKTEDFMSYLNLTLYLRNSQKRKVQLDYRDEDRFEKFHLNELIETLKSYSIDTVIK